MNGKNRYYDPTFKAEAVRLVLVEGRSIRDVERSLGMTIGLLKDWIKSHRLRSSEQQVPARGDLSNHDSDKRIKQLEKELSQARMERDILKKAVAIFSTDPHRYSGS
jgi:transposase